MKAEIPTMELKLLKGFVPAIESLKYSDEMRCIIVWILLRTVSAPCRMHETITSRVSSSSYQTAFGMPVELIFSTTMNSPRKMMRME